MKSAPFVEQVKDRRAALGSAGPAWLGARRDEALQAFAGQGVPSKKHEEWKYTQVAPVLDASFDHAPEVDAGLGRALAEQEALASASAVAVLVGGRFAPALSRTGEVPGLEVTSLAAALSGQPDTVEPWLGAVARTEGAPFVALNQALASDGVLVRVTPGTKVPGPVHVVHVLPAGVERGAYYPRSLIQVGRTAEVTVVETWVGGEAECLAFPVTEIVLEDGAALVHLQEERLLDQATWVGTVQVRQQRDSRYKSHAFFLGGKLVRQDLKVDLVGAGAESHLYGLYVLGDDEHVDNHTSIDHTVPHATSRQLYKGVLGGRSHGVFNGKVFFREGAQKSDTEQKNHNLLVSPGAQVDSKPQLEIFNDDVKASHGSTVGELDPAALFYCRSRGIGAEEAARMLTAAFAAAVVETVEDEALRERTYDAVEAALARVLDGELEDGGFPSDEDRPRAEEGPR